MTHPNFFSRMTAVYLAALLCALPLFCLAQEESRARTWETSFGLRRMDAPVFNFQRGSSVELDNDTGFGFEMGYNFSEAFKLSAAFDAFEPRYKANIVPDDFSQATEQIDGRVALSNVMVNGTYRFLPGPVTPFVSAGLGWVHVDTDVPTGEAFVGCWWDPWWGYLCDYYVPTKQEDDFAYQATVGAVWDVTSRLFLRGAFNRNWIDMDRAVGRSYLDVVKVDVGFRM